MKKLIHITGALIISTLFAMNAYAANISFFQEISFSGYDVYTPENTLVWQAVDGTDLYELPQFDPILGTLDSVTLTIVGELEHGIRILPSGVVIDENEPHSVSAQGNVGITATIPSGLGDSYLWQNFTTNADCEGTGGDPCDNFGEPNTLNFVDISGTYSGTDPEMAAFIGFGDLSDITIELLLSMDFMDSINLDTPEAELMADFGSTIPGLVIVSYEFTPVPVPSAIFLLGFGLIGIMGLQRRKQ